jgi:hypothetical protein
MCPHLIGTGSCRYVIVALSLIDDGIPVLFAGHRIDAHQIGFAHHKLAVFGSRASRLGNLSGLAQKRTPGGEQ